MITTCCVAAGAIEHGKGAARAARGQWFAAFASQASEAGDHGLCENVWAQLPSLGLEPQDSEWGASAYGYQEVGEEVESDRGVDACRAFQERGSSGSSLFQGRKWMVLGMSGRQQTFCEMVCAGLP